MVERVSSSSMRDLLGDGADEVFDVVASTGRGPPKPLSLWRQQLLDDATLDTSECLAGDASDSAHVA